jgi:hypothetical protein
MEYSPYFAAWYRDHGAQMSADREIDDALSRTRKGRVGDENKMAK